MHVHGMECDIEKFIHNTECQIIKVIECENQNYSMHGDFTAAGMKELHLLLEDRKHIMHWKDGMRRDEMPAIADKGSFFGGGVK